MKSSLLSLFSCFSGGGKNSWKKKNAKQLKLELVEYVAKSTIFELSEVEALYGLFTKLTKKGKPGLSKQTWKKELALSERFFDMFDKEGDGYLDFKEFACGLDPFHPEASRDSKVKLMFDFYDKERKAYLDREDIEVACRPTIGRMMSDEDMKWLIDNTFKSADTNGDGKIDEEEWRRLVKAHPIILKPCTLNILTEVTILYPDFAFNGVEYDLEKSIPFGKESIG